VLDRNAEVSTEHVAAMLHVVRRRVRRVAVAEQLAKLIRGLELR
jgi:hypothetical protein